MHLLRRLRGDPAGGALPQLRRRSGGPALAGGDPAGEVPRQRRAGEEGPRGLCVDSLSREGEGGARREAPGGGGGTAPAGPLRNPSSVGSADTFSLREKEARSAP